MFWLLLTMGGVRRVGVGTKVEETGRVSEVGAMGLQEEMP